MDGSGKITDFRVAQYVRMSTGHLNQQYSAHNQSDKIRKYPKAPLNLTLGFDIETLQIPLE